MRSTFLSQIARRFGFRSMPTSRPIRRARRPQLELLEDRNAPAVYRVDWSAIGLANGSSWVDAYPNLQSAIAVASATDEIWVAQGTYKPTTGFDRTISFNLESGVGIYGGFAGTETARSQRDPGGHVTTLSGDIGVVGDNSDNSYHVLYAVNVASTATADGFTITGGVPLHRGPADRGSSPDDPATLCRRAALNGG